MTTPNNSLRSDPMMFETTWAACPMMPICARTPAPSRAWKICPMPAPCCAWAVPWSITIARASAQVPRRITLDIDDTAGRKAPYGGGQQLRLFNAHYDEYGFQPIRGVRQHH